MIFSMDKDRVEWSLNSRIRLISIFTDVGFHSKGDSQDKGKTDAPLRSWWKPQPQYRYHDPRDVVKVADQSFETRFSESPFRWKFHLSRIFMAQNLKFVGRKLVNAKNIFSLDFYITSSGYSDNLYDKYFVRNKERQSWFLIRKSFISSRTSY